jgi:hypothetical protein
LFFHSSTIVEALNCVKRTDPAKAKFRAIAAFIAANFFIDLQPSQVLGSELMLAVALKMGAAKSSFQFIKRLCYCAARSNSRRTA